MAMKPKPKRATQRAPDPVVTRADIEAALIEQLTAAGACREHYVDLIRDYLALWDVKRWLILDINDRGVTYLGVSSTGVERWMNNPSVKELVGVNRQMLMILKELNLSTANAAAGGDEDDGL